MSLNLFQTADIPGHRFQLLFLIGEPGNLEFIFMAFGSQNRLLDLVLPAVKPHICFRIGQHITCQYDSTGYAELVVT